MNLSRFDWYQATLSKDGQMSGVDLLAHLTDEAPKAVKGRFGYSRGWQMRREGRTLATVLCGHGKPDHVVVTGEDSPLVAEALRRHAPGHTVSRADVCEDFAGGTDFFGATRSLCKNHLGGRVILTEYVETGLTGQAATLYVGSRESETRVRMYEKGKQDTAYAPDTVRLEVQVRPGKPDRKAYAAGIEPEAFWGFAKWSRWLIQEVAAKAAPAAPVRSERVSDLDGAVDAMAVQYGRRLIELIARHDGDLEAFALDILRRVPGA